MGIEVHRLRKGRISVTRKAECEGVRTMLYDLDDSNQFEKFLHLLHDISSLGIYGVELTFKNADE